MTTGSTTQLVLGAALPAFAVSCAAAALLRRWAPAFGLVDKPGARKVHVTPTPLGGGLAVWLGMITPLALGTMAVLAWSAAARGDGLLAPLGAALPEPPALVQAHLGGLVYQLIRLWQLLAAATVLMLLGLADDRWGLNWRLRLGVEFLVAAWMVAVGWRITLHVDLPWLTIPLSILWIVTLINSFNMLDNMDALSGGAALIIAATLAGLMLAVPKSGPGTDPHLFTGGFLCVFAGAMAGFLVHNRPPARIFLGDAGSYLAGFVLAISTIIATFSGGSLPAHSVATPLCLMAIPLYDTLSVILIRLRAGRSPFEGDKSHFSHRLVDLGLSKPQAVGTVHLATAVCCLAGALLHQVPSLFGAFLILLLQLLVLALLAILEAAGARARRRD